MSKSDYAIVFVGLCGNNYSSDTDPSCNRISECEGNDRSSIALPGMQNELLKQIRAVCKFCFLILGQSTND